MKVLFLAFLVLAPISAMAKDIVVLADIALLQDPGFAEMKEPDCNKPTDSGDLVVICLGGWSLYRLTGVTRRDGTRLEDTIALIYADPVLDGRWRLILQRLDTSAAKTYGARYKAISANPASENGGR